MVVFLILVSLHSSRAVIAPGNNKLQVSASFYPLYYFATQIGGDRAQVQNITPAGSEPHDFEPTIADMARIETGKLLIINGGIEGWGNKIKDQLSGKQVAIVTAGEGLFSDDQDPHVWVDPVLAEIEVSRIAKGFEKADPGNSIYYRSNAQNLTARLAQMDQSYRQGLANCREKDIITSHAAFGHLTKRYGLNQVAITGLSPDAEPSPAKLAQIVQFAKTHNVKYIFFESLVSPKLSETLANEIGAKTLVLDPLEGLSNDDIEKGKDYFTVMQQNLVNLRTALQCQ